MNSITKEIKKQESPPKVIKNLFNDNEIQDFLKLYHDLPITVHNKKQNVIKKRWLQGFNLNLEKIFRERLEKEIGSFKMDNLKDEEGKDILGLIPAVLIAIPLFGVSVLNLGIPLIFLLISLYLFGVTLGLLVTSGLLRYGPSFENIAWASLFFLAPLGCIYYPIDILPLSLQIIAKGLPLVHIFEEMRSILMNNTVNYLNIFKSISISVMYFIFGVIIFYISYFGAKKRGTLIGLIPAVIIAIPLFGVSVLNLGIPLIFLLLALYLFGVTLGLLVTSGLLRYGPSFENIAWASLFFLAPLGCIYYPIDILPLSLQIIAKGLPLVHIFEEMRSILMNNTVNYFNIFKSISISMIYFMFGVIVFYISYFGAKKRGTLMNMGE